MFGISLPELLLIFVLILVVLGPEKLPEVARWVGKGLREVRKASNLMRDALMLDDDEGYKNRRITAPKLTKTEAKPATAKAPTMTSAPAHLALDQAGEDFDRALEDHLNSPYSELIDVPLHPGAPSDDLFAVDLQDALGTDKLFPVFLAASTEEHLPW